MPREVLPKRRFTETRDFMHQNDPYTLSIGYFEDGRPAEVFINHKMNESALGVLAHDAAVLISIALQHGSSVRELRAAIARTENEVDSPPQSVVGTVLDILAGEVP